MQGNQNCCSENHEETPRLIAGLDEVGLGALAGPLCIAVVGFLPGQDPIPGVTDSKQVSKKKREKLSPLIQSTAAYVSIGWTSPQDLDTNGVAWAWHNAANQALAGLPDWTDLVVDGERAPQMPDTWTGWLTVVPKADANYWQVGAASIVAKVARDNLMTVEAALYPEYGFEKNAGYGSRDHTQAIKMAGPCRLHRRLFLRKLKTASGGLWE